MSNSDNGGTLIGLMWVVTIAIAIGTGIMAWNWIEPKNFWGAIGFLLAWGLFIKIGHFLAVALIGILGGMD